MSSDNPDNSDQRCQYRKADGRRCRSLRALDHPNYCAQHAGWLVGETPPPPEDLTRELIGPLGDFRSATAINYAVGKLTLLVASRRISTREAATLGYLFQLLLQTVQGVSNEISMTENSRTSYPDLRKVLTQTANLTTG